MNSLNLYILCEGTKLQKLGDYQRSLANSNEKKKIKDDEIATLKCFVNELLKNGAEISDLDGFFYGFSIPQISKEFDLLKIYKEGFVVNIELKSKEIELERIEYQLKKNRYYLSHLNKKIYSFTYVKVGNSGQVYLYDGVQLEKSSIKDIIELIKLKKKYIKEKIEELFKAKDYLISPINTPELFVKGNYYLTGQQEEIKNRIINGIYNGKQTLWGIKGSAGTGKTLLLYDIAKSLGNNMKVCIIHSGILSQGHELLNSKLDSVDIIPAKACNENVVTRYECILIDESQRLYQGDFDCLVKAFQERKIYCIFAYDYYQVLSYAEIDRNIPEQLSKINCFRECKLSEKIRTNKEVASFIKNVIDLSHRPKCYMNYSNIEVLYADNYNIAKTIVEYYVSYKGYLEQIIIVY